MAKLLSTGLDSRTISIETLFYPFEWVAGLIDAFNLSVCIDVGHLLLNNYDIDSVARKYLARTAIIHLHGIQNNRDHQGLETLSTDMMRPVIAIMKQFKGVVSIEVFSYAHLKSSLICLVSRWQAMSDRHSEVSPEYAGTSLGPELISKASKR
jgi:sugar phosphate isomerase/epimerase